MPASGCRLPDVVQLLPSRLHAERQRQRRSFLIDEILHPDFGRRRSTVPTPEVGENHVTSIWQPFASSPSDIDAPCSRMAQRACALQSRATTQHGGAENNNRMRKSSAKRKPTSTGSVSGRTLNYSHSTSADESTAVSHRPAASADSVSLSSRSSSSSSSSSSASCSSGSDVSTDVTSSQGARAGDAPPAKFGKLALPAWVYCTRYSDRPSSGTCIARIFYSLHYQQLMYDRIITTQIKQKLNKTNVMHRPIFLFSRRIGLQNKLLTFYVSHAYVHGWIQIN